MAEQTQSPQSEYGPQLLNEVGHGAPTVEHYDAIAAKLRPDEITSKDAEKFARFAGEVSPAGKDALPIFIDDNNQSLTPSIKQVITKQGSSGLLINDAAHEWTPAYVDRHIVNSDQQIESIVRNGGDKPLTEKDISPDVLKELSEISKRMGNTGANAPKFYIDTTDNTSIPNMQSSTTREGTNIIEINQAYIDTLKNGEKARETFEGSVWHEEAHLALKHTSPQNLAKAHNIPGYRMQEEKQADLLAFGPNGSRNPEALIKTLELDRSIRFDEFKKEHPNATLSELDKSENTPSKSSSANGLEHPLFEERKDYLQELGRSLKASGLTPVDLSAPSYPVAPPAPGKQREDKLQR